MLQALMGRIDVISGAGEKRPIAKGQAFRYTILPLASLSNTLVEKLQQAINDNPALVQPGATVTAANGSLVINGLSANDWQYVGDFRDTLEQVIYASAPFSQTKFEADVFDAVAQIDPAPTPTPTPTGTGTGAAAGATGTKLLGVPVMYWAIAGAVLLFMKGSK